MTKVTKMSPGVNKYFVTCNNFKQLRRKEKERI